MRGGVKIANIEARQQQQQPQSQSETKNSPSEKQVKANVEKKKVSPESHEAKNHTKEAQTATVFDGYSSSEQRPLALNTYKSVFVTRTT